MGTVNKEAVVRSAAEKAGMSLATARSVIEAFLDDVRARAEAGDTVRFTGFGSFQVRARAARQGRNPATGETIAIPESRKLTFKASKTT